MCLKNFILKATLTCTYGVIQYWRKFFAASLLVKGVTRFDISVLSLAGRIIHKSFVMFKLIELNESHLTSSSRVCKVVLGYDLVVSTMIP